MANSNINKVKTHFLRTFEKGISSAYPYLPKHVLEVEKWANKLLKIYPKANKEILLLSVWLHDIGQAIGDKNDDHAIKSEKETLSFLSKLKLKPEKIKKVAHCVRAHRCRDIQPETLEEKLLAVADSASHMTDINYIVHLSDWPKKLVFEKLERDYRDVGIFPKLKKEIAPLYKAWKRLMKGYPDKI